MQSNSGAGTSAVPQQLATTSRSAGQPVDNSSQPASNLSMPSRSAMSAEFLGKQHASLLPAAQVEEEAAEQLWLNMEQGSLPSSRHAPFSSLSCLLEEPFTLTSLDSSMPELSFAPVAPSAPSQGIAMGSAPPEVAMVTATSAVFVENGGRQRGLSFPHNCACLLAVHTVLPCLRDCCACSMPIQGVHAGIWHAL